MLKFWHPHVLSIGFLSITSQLHANKAKPCDPSLLLQPQRFCSCDEITGIVYSIDRTRMKKNEHYMPQEHPDVVGRWLSNCHNMPTSCWFSICLYSVPLDNKPIRIG